MGRSWAKKYGGESNSGKCWYLWAHAQVNTLAIQYACISHAHAEATKQK